MDNFLVNTTLILYPTAVEVADLSSDPVSTTCNESSDGTEFPSSGFALQASDKCRGGCGGHSWRVDGHNDGVRFFAIPDFAYAAPPLRVDVYVPQPRSSSFAVLGETHDTDHTNYAADRRTISGPSPSEVTCILSHWSANLEDFADRYRCLPYGSHIVIEDYGDGANAKCDVNMVPDFATERAWLSLDALQTMWSLSLDEWPKTLDWTQLRLQSQPHDAISLVTLPTEEKEHGKRTFVYKSILRDLQHFYHELKTLLLMPPHPNIIARPHYIVTKKARFGGKRGVCGMILDYHPGGTMFDMLVSLPRDRPLQVQHQISVAKQITAALIHVRGSLGFYANLKPHNIMLPRIQGKYRPVLIDFEQRSGWFSWSAPEIHYVNYLEHLAIYSQDRSTRKHYEELLQGYIPKWKPLDMKARYDNPVHGYAAPWSALSDDERGSAQVFMLGKLLWCLFESAHSVNSCLTPETLREPACGLVFPAFSSTPEPLRACIRKCTTGAPEWEGRWPAVIKKGDHVYRLNDSEAMVVNIADVQQAAKQWWQEQIKQAERFVTARSNVHSDPKQPSCEDYQACAFMRSRPSLEEVLEELIIVEQSLFA